MAEDSLRDFLIKYEEYLDGKRDYYDLPILGSKEQRNVTWGSNATGTHYTCQYCGGDAWDDTDEGPDTHQQVCEERKPLRRLKKFFGISNLPKVRVVSNDSRKGKTKT